MIYESGQWGLVGAGAASANGDWLQMARGDAWSATIRVSASAATLAATMKFQATDFDAKSGSEATFTGWTAASALATGITLANGVWTFASPSAGTYEILLVSYTMPRWLRAVWTYTSGGGTVTADVSISGWE